MDPWGLFFKQLSTPVSVILGFMVFLEAGACIWLAKQLNKERKFSHSYVEELMLNTKIMQELADMIKVLVLGRRGD